MNDVKSLIDLVKTSPEETDFKDVIRVIDSAYKYVPTNFACGDAVSEAGSNEGSCKIFAFAKKHQLTEQQTLHLFGDFYRQDVLENPQGQDHANIRNFMKTGWGGVSFESEPLS